MQARPVLIALLAVGAVAVTALLAWPGPRAGPIDSLPTAPAIDSAAPVDVDVAGFDDSPDPGDDDAPPAIVRTAVAAGNGWLCVRPGLGTWPAAGPIPSSSNSWLVLRAVPVRGTGSRPAVDLGWLDGRWLGAELPSGAWRIQCVRGPGDPPDADPSPGWIVDPEDELAVPSGETTKATVRIVRSADPPDQGRATIVGMAFVDGVPAAEYVVRLAPFADAAVTRVDGDGSFRLDDAPAGWRDLELWSRARPGPLRFARLTIAPRHGEVLRVELQGQTARLDGIVVTASGDPVERAQVELWGEDFLLVGGQVQRPQRFAWSDAAGRFSIEPIPPGRYSVSASDGDGLVPRTAVEARPGGSPQLRLVRQPWARVRGAVEVVDGASTLSRQRLDLILNGPVDRRIRSRGGKFDAPRLIEGSYRVRAMTPRGWLDADAPLVVPAGGLDDATITLRRRR